jgi:hypothetical protein
MFAVVVDRTIFHGQDIWGSKPQRVFAVVPWRWLAKVFCRVWVTRHVHGKAFIMDVATLNEQTKEQGLDIPLMEYDL